MKSIVVCIFGVVLATGFSQGQTAEIAGSDRSETKAEIHWMSFEEAFRENKKNPKKWIIDISTEWCGWCKRMDATTFSDSLIIDYINNHYYAVALDGEEKETIDLGGQQFNFVPSGKRGYHELAAQLMGGQMSYPTIVFLNENVESLSVLPGFKSSEDLMPILHFFQVFDPVSNPIKWDHFRSNEYESPYAPAE